MSQEILINSTCVGNNGELPPYEFVLNQYLIVTECVQVKSSEKNSVIPIFNASNALEGLLFELNHVRVNPRIDNSEIIAALTQALVATGVNIYNQPHHNDVASCFRPMGEISDSVRFYLNSHGKVIFLSPNARPKLIDVNNPKNSLILDSLRNANPIR